MLVTKEIESIIYNKNKFNVGYWADEYIISCNKHLKINTLNNIYDKIANWVNKHNGSIIQKSKVYIDDDNKCIKIQIRFSTYNECKQVLAKVS